MAYNHPKVQIGWYVVEQETEFRNAGFECAAWYEVVKVPKGKYPVYGEMQYHERDKHYTDKVNSNGVGCGLKGTVTASDFTSHFGGVRYGSKIDEEIGKESMYYLSPYAYDIAGAIAKGDTKWELLPEFEVRESSRYMDDYNNKERILYGIYKVDNTELAEMEQRHTEYARS